MQERNTPAGCADGTEHCIDEVECWIRTPRTRFEEMPKQQLALEHEMSSRQVRYSTAQQITRVQENSDGCMPYERLRGGKAPDVYDDQVAELGETAPVGDVRW